jgi:hypothetical protein
MKIQTNGTFYAFTMELSCFLLTSPYFQERRYTFYDSKQYRHLSSTFSKAIVKRYSKKPRYVVSYLYVCVCVCVCMYKQGFNYTSKELTQAPIPYVEDFAFPQKGC